MYYGFYPQTEKQIMTIFNNSMYKYIRSSGCPGCDKFRYKEDYDIFGTGDEMKLYNSHSSKEAIDHFEKVKKAYRDGVITVDYPPPELYLSHCTTCNFKCKMCGDFAKPRPPLNVERVKNLIKEIGWKRLDRFGTSGGETLFADDGKQLLNWLCETGMEGTCFYLTTNGSLLNYYIDKLSNLENIFMTMSVDGAGEVYEHIRSFPWERIKANMEAISAEAAKHEHWRININSIIMRSTLPTINELIRVATDLNISIWFSYLGGHGSLAPEENLLEYPVSDREVQYMKDGIELADSLGAIKARDSLTFLLEDMSKKWKL